MPYPYIPEKTQKRFYVPKTLAADFTEFLQNDIPNAVMNFELLHDWYDKHSTGYHPHYIRGEIYPDSTKSRYSNTDNNMNFRAAVDSGIQKGDMIIQPDGTIFILDWEVALESNNAPSRALRCNMYLTVYRNRAEVTDDNGFLSDDGDVLIDQDGFVIQNNQEETATRIEGQDTIVESIPANAYRYDGRPEYSAVSGTPGVTPNALTLMTVQYNEQTKNIRIDDLFTWGDVVYKIVDVNRVGVHIDESHGVLTLQAKKASGGIL